MSVVAFADGGAGVAEVSFVTAVLISSSLASARELMPVTSSSRMVWNSACSCMT